MKTIRASEIASYVFCHRSWWLHEHGNTPDNRAELAGGKSLHAQHGRSALTAGCIQILGYTILLAALILAAIYITLQFI